MEENLYLTPIIKVAGNYCNNRCGYCFYRNLNQTSSRRMSFELLESFIRQHTELVSGNLAFIWHGGEPLLAGPDFFREIIRLQGRIIPRNRMVRNSIQTNGTLVNDEWAAFFKENDFRVGVSLDGDEKNHNRFRVNHAGHGTFDDTLRGINILRKHGISISVIQTITQANACHVEENFQFFTKEIGLSGFSINPFFDLSDTNPRMVGQSLSNDTLTRIMKKYIDLWIQRDDSALRIREVDNYLAGLHGKRAGTCSFSGSCHMFYSVDYDGSVYPCDRLSGDGEFSFGTLASQTLKEILREKKWQDFKWRTRELPTDCTSCEWKNSCNNGCTAHRVGGMSGKYFFCESRKEVFAYLHSVLK